MSDLISRDEAIDAMIMLGIKRAVPILATLQSAEPERKTGKWISHENYDECSKCHCFTSVGFNYCPHCGADMRGEE